MSALAASRFSFRFGEVAPGSIGKHACGRFRRSISSMVSVCTSTKQGLERMQIYTLVPEPGGTENEAILQTHDCMCGSHVCRDCGAVRVDTGCSCACRNDGRSDALFARQKCITGRAGSQSPVLASPQLAPALAPSSSLPDGAPLLAQRLGLPQVPLGAPLLVTWYQLSMRQPHMSAPWVIDPGRIR